MPECSPECVTWPSPAGPHPARSGIRYAQLRGAGGGAVVMQLAALVAAVLLNLRAARLARAGTRRIKQAQGQAREALPVRRALARRPFREQLTGRHLVAGTGFARVVTRVSVARGDLLHDRGQPLDVHLLVLAYALAYAGVLQLGLVQ